MSTERKMMRQGMNNPRQKLSPSLTLQQRIQTCQQQNKKRITKQTIIPIIINFKKKTYMTIMIDARRLHVSKRVCAGSPHNARTPTLHLHQLPTARSQWTTPRRGGKEFTPTHFPHPLTETFSTRRRRQIQGAATISRLL